MINSQEIFEDARRAGVIAENNFWREKQVSERAVAQILANRRLRERAAGLQAANESETTKAQAEQERDEALANEIFRMTQGCHSTKPQYDNTDRAKRTPAFVVSGKSDDDLAEEIFKAGGGNTGFEHFSDGEVSGDDEDEALANEIFELSC